MSSTYTIGDFLIRLKNAYLAGRQDMVIASTKNVSALAKLLKDEGYIKEVKQRENNKTKRGELIIQLLYKKNNPALTDVKLVSKPSAHIYVGKEDLLKVNRNYGIGVVSTNQGMMTVKDALAKNLGGELICRLS